MREGLREDWRQINLTGDPRMLVGWREPSRRLQGLRIKLHEAVFSDLIELCQPAVDRIQNDKERPFESFAALDDREYFWYGHEDLPKHLPPTADPQDGDALADEESPADLVRLVQGVDNLSEATRANLEEWGFSFYAICWPHLESIIGFVTRINPVSTLKPGYRFFQYGDAMKVVEHPDFALKAGADVVIGRTGIAILSSYSFEVLLGDVGMSFEHVQRDLATVKRALAQRIRLTASAESALLAEASRTRSTAKRLRTLPARLRAIGLSVESLRSSLVTHGVDPGLILNQEDEFSFDRDGVPVFLDAIDGRLFEDDLGGERRRADRYSRR